MTKPTIPSEQNSKVLASIKESISGSLNVLEVMIKHDVFGLSKLVDKMEICETVFESKNSTILLTNLGESAQSVRENCNVYSSMLDIMIQLVESSRNLKNCIEEYNPSDQFYTNCQIHEQEGLSYLSSYAKLMGQLVSVEGNEV